MAEGLHLLIDIVTSSRATQLDKRNHSNSLLLQGSDRWDKLFRRTATDRTKQTWLR
jgi:hypothetical protein